MRQANLKLWVMPVIYATGIVVGAKLIPQSVLSTQVLTRGSETASVVTAAVVTVVCSSIFWAVTRSNPRWGLTYGLLIIVFLVAGTAAGLNSTGKINSNRQTGGKHGISTSSRAGYDTEKIPVIKAVRQQFKDTIAKTISARYQGLLAGIVLGMTEDIPPDMAADFKTTGLSHILAVSGLNISILIIAFGYLIRAATIDMGKAGRVLAFAVTAVAVVFYMFLTKLQPSVVRAGVMGLAALVAVLASRPGNAFPALAAAAMAILVVDPAALFNIGFQLSFAATIAILLFTPLFEQAQQAKQGGLRSAASLTLAAQLGVAPLLVLYFGRLSLVSIIANVAVGPAIAPATILGIAIAVAGAISTGLARVAAFLTEPCLAYIAGAAGYFAEWPYASVSLPPVSVLHVAAYYCLVGLLYQALTRYNRWRSTRATLNDFPNRKFAGVATATFVFVGLVVGLIGCQAVKSRPPAGLRAVFIDVGQGDAALIQAEDGAAILIDGGPEPDSAVTTLRKYGIRAIDLMIVTHAHADHVTGIEPVANGYLVKKAVLPSIDSKAKERIMNALARQDADVTRARQGQAYKVGKYLKVNILSPDEATTCTTGSDESNDANNRAVVALIQYKEIKLMLAGDIEKETEEEMLNDHELSHADVLKVPHHGSKNGADENFIKAVRPEIAIISAGLNNPFHHPAPSTVLKLKQAGAAVYRTDNNGSVIIESDGTTTRVATSTE